MADDRKKRPHRDHGYPRPPSSVPVEIDPELTPPPREPPTAEAFDTLPPPMQLRALRNVVAEQSAAIERVWDARHVSQRLERLETTVAQDTRRVGELIVAVEHWGETSRKAFDKSLANAEEQIRIDGALVRILDKLSELVDEVKGFNATVNGVRERITEAESEIARIAQEQNRHAGALAILDTRISIVERKDEDKALVATAEQAQVRRLINKANAVKALIAAAIAVAGVLAGMNL